MFLFQGRDYEKTTLTSLQIGVENEEPLWVCKEKSTGRTDADLQDSTTIILKVIDVNDPPEFTQSTVHVYHNEEEKPGKVLFTPEVHDVDSNVSQIRLVSVFLCLLSFSNYSSYTDFYISELKKIAHTLYITLKQL